MANNMQEYLDLTTDAKQYGGPEAMKSFIREAGYADGCAVCQDREYRKGLKTGAAASAFVTVVVCAAANAIFKKYRMKKVLEEKLESISGEEKSARKELSCPLEKGDCEEMQSENSNVASRLLIDAN